MKVLLSLTIRTDIIIHPPNIVMGGGVYRNHPVCQYVHPSFSVNINMSCKCNFSLTDAPLLMKLYTVAVKDQYALRRIILVQTISREMINSGRQGDILF